MFVFCFLEKIMKRKQTPAFITALMLCAFLFLAFVLLFSSVFGESITYYQRSMSSIMFSLVVFGIPVLVYEWIIDFSDNDDHLPRKEFRGGALCGFAWLIPVSAIILVAMLANRDMAENVIFLLCDVDITNDSNISDTTLAQFVVLAMSNVVVGPMMEELFFRKVFIRRYGGVYGIISCIFSTVTFVLIHSIYEQMIYIIPLSAICSVLYYKTGNVVYSVVVHSIINFIGLLYPPIRNTVFSITNISEMANERQLITNIIGSMLVMAISVLLMVLWFEFAFRKNEDKIEKTKNRSYAYVLIALIFVICLVGYHLYVFFSDFNVGLI